MVRMGRRRTSQGEKEELRRNHGATELRNKAALQRNYESKELRIYEQLLSSGITEIRNYESTEQTIMIENKRPTYSTKKKAFPKEEKTRTFDGEMKPLMTEEENGRNHGKTEKRKYGNTKLINCGNESVDSEVRKFVNPIKPLMSEAEKSEAQVLDLSYDFACRIIRLYKYLNEGKLGKADRDIVDALGRQLLRSATSINANVNEAQHPQSDADFLSKATIALKESRESETWLHMLSDNGYLDQRMSESILHDCARINKILITITAKLRKRLKE